jgi:hypothetical protein
MKEELTAFLPPVGRFTRVAFNYIEDCHLNCRCILHLKNAQLCAKVLLVVRKNVDGASELLRHMRDAVQKGDPENLLIFGDDIQNSIKNHVA